MKVQISETVSMPIDEILEVKIVMTSIKLDEQGLSTNDLLLINHIIVLSYYGVGNHAKKYITRILVFPVLISSSALVSATNNIVSSIINIPKKSMKS